MISEPADFSLPWTEVPTISWTITGSFLISLLWQSVVRQLLEIVQTVQTEVKFGQIRKYDVGMSHVDWKIKLTKCSFHRLVGLSDDLKIFALPCSQTWIFAYIVGDEGRVVGEALRIVWHLPATFARLDQQARPGGSSDVPSRTMGRCLQTWATWWPRSFARTAGAS